MNLRLILITVFCLLITGHCSLANDSRIVSGRISDSADGKPIAGAAVMIQYSRTGSITNADGRFSIKLPIENENIEIHAIGYISMVVEVEEGVTELTIELERDEMMQVEVVSIAEVPSRLEGKVAGVSSPTKKPESRKNATWRRSTMPDNAIRLEVGDGRDDYLPLEAVQMSVQVEGFRVRVLLDCFFYNDKQEGLEGTFKLKLPNGASPYYFAFGEEEYLNEDKSVAHIHYNKGNHDLSPEKIKYTEGRAWNNVKEARIVPKDNAAIAYEETVGLRIDPALMEWAGSDFFTCRVFPLQKNALHRVVVGYDVNMTEGLNFREYHLVLPQNVNDLWLDVKMLASENITPVISPLVPKQYGNDFVSFSLYNPEVKEFYIGYDNADAMVLANKNKDYFAANYRINLPETDEPYTYEDAIIMLDVSLSSQPDKFNVWLTLINEVLSRNEDRIKRFAVMNFNIDSFWWKRKYVDNTAKNRNDFLQYAYTLALEGATDLGKALNEAMYPAWIKDYRPKHIFLMSDADYNWGESNRFALLPNRETADRIHTYKIGMAGTNTAVLDYLSRETKGYSFSITGEEEAAIAAAVFRYRPWEITNISVPGVSDFLISGRPTQLYNGQKLLFSGRGIPSGNIVITLSNGLETQTLTFPTDNRLQSTLAKRIYGETAFASLDNYGVQAKQSTEPYAVYYRIPGIDYSFLMLENENEYYHLVMDEREAEIYVMNNSVASIINELNDRGITTPKGNTRTDFMEWLQGLSQDKTIQLWTDETFAIYLNRLPAEAFEVKLKNYKYKIQKRSEQSDSERLILQNEFIFYDELLPLAEKRKKKKNKETAVKLLSSVVERNPADYIALRDIALQCIDWEMGDMAYYMMRRVIDHRPQEAIAYLTAAEALAASGHIDMAMIYYYICLNAEWSEDYGNFKEIAALKAMRYLTEIKQKIDKKDRKLKLTQDSKDFLSYLRRQVMEYLDSEDLLITDADVVVIINWNTNFTDVDLHVLEPTGEVCFYGNSETKIGGRLTIDVVEGYGPEMYVLKNAVPGEYSIYIDYYSDSETRTATVSKVYADIYLGWGYKKEQHIRRTLVLKREEDQVEILKLTIK